MRVRGIRGVLAVAVAAASFTGVPHAVAAPLPALGAVTVVKATGPVSVDVRLTRDATIATPFDDTPDVSVTGGGALAMFALVGRDSGNRSVTLVGGATGTGAAQRRFALPLPQFPAPGGGSYEVVKTFADTTQVPAGTYRLYVLPGGTPVQLTLRLHGPAGRAVLAPVRHAVGETAAGTPWPADTPARGNVFASTVARHLTGPGLALHVLRSRLDGEVAWQLQMCHDNPASTPAPLASAPGCPSGEKHTLTDHRAPEVTPDAKLFVQGFAGLPAGDHGVSVVYASEARATDADYVTAWLTY